MQSDPNGPRFTDSHCHLATGEMDAGSLLVRARAAGVHALVVPATNLDDAPRAVAIAQSQQNVWAAVGFHPHDAKDCGEAGMQRIEALAAKDKVVAIGEVGLDYHYEHSPRDVQKQVFAFHIDLAKRRGLPLIIHNRESTADLVDILESEGSRGVRGILHSFTESYEVARRLIDLGFFISFSGILTFRTAEALREVARALPHDSVLIETDTPYLAPIPFRGKTNEPAFVVKVAEVLASLWGRPIEEVAAVTTENFQRAFGVNLGFSQGSGSEDGESGLDARRAK